MKFKDTSEIDIPKDPLDQVIGQDQAVKIAKLCATQRRHLLLIGPPGIGKSMIAQGIAMHLPKPKEEIAVTENQSNPNRPKIEIRKQTSSLKTVFSPSQVPTIVSEKLGFMCPFCGKITSYKESVCPECNRNKFSTSSDFISRLDSTSGNELQKRVNYDSKTYERFEDKIVCYSFDKEQEKVIIPLERNTFVMATGASETELLGDVLHDPYGGNSELGSPPYQRVIPGAVHEAHEGVLFIDELPSLENLQRSIFTAMQEKKFPIVGRNPHSAGASVRVDNVPCDFILVGSINPPDLEMILPPLRSRIKYGGYELTMQVTMPDNETNREKMAQFVAQEIAKDGRIPNADLKTVNEIIEESRNIAKTRFDIKDGLGLSFRELGGIIKLAGDMAVLENSKIIQVQHLEEARKIGGKIINQKMDGKEII